MYTPTHHIAVAISMNYIMFAGGQAVAKWLRHYATSQKAAGSKPDDANELYQFT
jgi:hypothetical protein